MEAAMSAKPPDPKEMGFYLSLAQVGLEMAVPPGLGLWLDHQFGWTPWGVIVGAVLGFVTGILHLVQLVGRNQDAGPSGPKQGKS
jgi:F0F1-type ATP synthase assembly protein I